MIAQRMLVLVALGLAACGGDMATAPSGSEPTGPVGPTGEPLRPTFKLSEEGQSQSMAGGGASGACSLVQTTRSWECMWRLGAGGAVLVGSGYACGETLGVECIAGGAGSVYGLNDWWNHVPTDEGPPVPSNPYHCLDCGMGDPGLVP